MRMSIAAAVLALAASAPAWAQSTPTGSVAPPVTSGGSSTGTGAPIAPAPAGSKDLDLPLEPVVAPPPPTAITPPAPPTPIEPDDDDGDDPSDAPPPTFYGEEMDTESDSIFYVIDASCSMDWDEASYVDLDGNHKYGPRMDRAKNELIRSIMGLSDNFKFNIIKYDCSTGQWRGAMVEANDPNKQSAQGWVMSLQPSGATGTGPAVAQALGERDNKLVVLLTDGAPNCGVSSGGGGGWGWDDDGSLDDHRRVIRNANTQGATINVFGIAASGSYRSFCQGVASDNGGSYFDVP